MSYNYSKLQDMSARLLKKFGRSVQFSRVVRGEYLPDSSRTINDQTIMYSVFCVQSNWTTLEKQKNDILETDLKIIAEVADFQKEDVATLDGETYQVYAFEKLQPSSDKLLYTLQLRK